MNLERTHWETTLWIDDQKIGSKNTLGTAHSYALPQNLASGNHVLSIRVDNSVKDIEVGNDAHSITDNTQSNWNGLVGVLELRVKPQLYLEKVKIYPDVINKQVQIVAKIINTSEKAVRSKLTLQASFLQNHEIALDPLEKEITIKKNQEITLIYPMGEAVKLWDEFNPNLYQMAVRLSSDLGTDSKQVNFGMRSFKAKGSRFEINNRPVFLRGTLECAIFPKTGYSPTNKEEWIRIFQIIKNHGLNHMRFHSWCPPEAAFDAADKTGVYLQVEASAWAKIGDGAPVDQWLYKEAQQILDDYGNHPSFVMMAYGNEPSGDHHKEYLIDFVNHFKNQDSTKVYTSAAGWPFVDNADYFNTHKPRIQQWNQNLNSIINREPPQTLFDFQETIDTIPMPVVSHEIGQWCVYPNYKELPKYTGVLKPKNLEIFQETLNDNHLGHLADSLLLASGKLQTLCYKADIEAALRTKGFAGFQLLDLHDFPGQGTALVGVLDAFWDEKGYVTPEEFNAFSGQTVPLARLKQRTFLNSETLEADVEIAHFGATAIENIKPHWRLETIDGSIIKEGYLPTTDIPVGNGISLGKIIVDLDQITSPQQLNLKINVGEFSNDWDVWVYPSSLDHIKSDELRVVEKLDTQTISFLENGGRVLLNPTKGDLKPEKGGDIGVGFSSIFWNTSWTNGQKPHTLGILCYPEHEALAEFPTEYFSNWQWWDAMSHSNAIILNDLDNTIKPIVRVIDDWFENRSLALLFETKVGQGKLLVSGIDLHSDLETRKEAVQLLYSLKKYMVSDQFNPTNQLAAEEITALFKYN